MPEANPTAKKSPGRKATPTQKVAAPARTSRRTGARTAAAPAAEVEATAVKAAAALPRPSPQRASAKAAAALRGEPEPAPAAAVEEPAAATEAQPEEMTAEVEFLNRKVLVRLPTDEQLVMYRRLSVQFQDLTADGAADNLTTEQALRELDRAIRLVQSVLVHDRDKERIEEDLLEGKVTLAQCTGLLKQAFQKLNEKHEEMAAGDNRAARRSRARLED